MKTFETRDENVTNATGVSVVPHETPTDHQTNPIIQVSQEANIVVSQILLPQKSALIVPTIIDEPAPFPIP